MKLELKHLVGYLPYRLEALDYLSKRVKIIGLKNETYFIEDGNIYAYGDIQDCKPILRLLSGLTNEDTIEFYGLGSIELELIDINEWTEELIQEIKTGQKFQLSQFEYLFSKHFDIYNLIENNLAIDKNTIL